MRTPNNILLPYNASEAAQQAVPYALDLAAQTGATLHTLSVEVLRGGLPVPSGTPDAITDNVRAHFETVNREHAQGRYAPEDVHFVHAARRDIEASAAVLLYAAAQDIDLIVMGTHGRRGLKRLALGSVAEKVVRWASCPVLTMRGRGEAETGTPSVRRILAPADFSPGSRAAVGHAKALAAQLGAQLELFHAVEETMHPAFYGPFVQSVYDARPGIETEATQRLETLYAAADGPSGAATFHAAPGPAPKAIAKRARTTGADLIVMATRERTLLDHLANGFTLGGVTEKVVRTAPCPVLTARHFGQTLVGSKDGANVSADAVSVAPAAGA